MVAETGQSAGVNRLQVEGPTHGSRDRRPFGEPSFERHWAPSSEFRQVEPEPPVEFRMNEPVVVAAEAVRACAVASAPMPVRSQPCPHGANDAIEHALKADRLANLPAVPGAVLKAVGEE